MYCCRLYLYFLFYVSVFFFFKQKTAYEMRISDWSSDVCSSDLWRVGMRDQHGMGPRSQDHGGEGLGRVVGQVIAHPGISGEAESGHEQRVAIGRRGRHCLRADDGCRAGLVVDDHRLSPRLLQLLADQAPKRVVESARRKRHDDSDGLDRKSTR